MELQISTSSKRLRRSNSTFRTSRIASAMIVWSSTIRMRVTVIAGLPSLPLSDRLIGTVQLKCVCADYRNRRY